MKKIWVFVIVASVVILLVVGGLLLWYFLSDDDQQVSSPTEPPVINIELNGSFGDVRQYAGYRRIPDAGDMFWWFYPTTNNEERPILVWLNGVVDLPASVANLAMFGPYDSNMNIRNNSWIDDYNLLFIDSPIGTGFSKIISNSGVPTSVAENAEHLFLTLDSFYSLHEEYKETPVYLMGQGHGAQIALALAARLQQSDAEDIGRNVKGISLGNGIIDPGVVFNKLGFYLEELGYIDGAGRDAIEKLNTDVQELLSAGNNKEAFDELLSLENYINENAGAVAVNLRRIVDKLPQHNNRDYFNQKQNIKKIIQSDLQLEEIMDGTIGPSLGVPDDHSFDKQRDLVVQAFQNSFMISAVPLVEELLQNTNLVVTIYNGNLDAISNTPGQLDWVNNLRWNGQEQFLAAPRRSLVLNRTLEGYFKQSERLNLYWINVAGQQVPIDSPITMRRVLRSIGGY